MLKIKAYRQYYYQSAWAAAVRYLLIVVFGSGASAFMVLQYQNYLGALVMIISAITMLIIVSLPKKFVLLEMDEENLQFDLQVYPIAMMSAWVMVDMGEVVEFVIQTSGLSDSYLYFYIPKNNSKLSELSMKFAQTVPYNEDLASSDTMHRILKATRLG